MTISELITYLLDRRETHELALELASVQAVRVGVPSTVAVR